MEFCKKCRAEKGLTHEATVEYGGEKYCTVCERRWISARRRAVQAMAELPARLRQAVKGQGYKFREVADWVDVGEVVFSRYVKEEDPVRPGLDTLVAICGAIKTHPNELLGFVDPKRTAAEKEAEKWRGIVHGIVKVLVDAGIHLGDKPDSNLRSDRNVDHWEHQERAYREAGDGTY